MTSYYLRKFIEDRQETLHTLLPDLHGEITLDRLFNRMCRQSQNADAQINIIESLVDIHKTVVKTAPPESTEMLNLDKRLLASLGATESIDQPSSARLSIAVARDCLETLNTLQTQARFYLGETIGTKYLLETQPDNQWCQQFKVTPKTGVVYEGQLSESLKPEQITYFETWVDDFSTRCGNIFKSFMDTHSNPEALFDNM